MVPGARGAAGRGRYSGAQIDGLRGAAGATRHTKRRRVRKVAPGGTPGAEAARVERGIAGSDGEAGGCATLVDTSDVQWPGAMASLRWCTTAARSAAGAWSW